MKEQVFGIRWAAGKFDGDIPKIAGVDTDFTAEERRLYVFRIPVGF